MGQGWVAVSQGQDGVRLRYGSVQVTCWAPVVKVTGRQPTGYVDLEGLSQRPPEPVASGPETQAPCSPERGRECNCVIHWSPRTDGRRTLIGKGIGPV